VSSKENKWTVPDLPPTLFAGQKERDFAKQVADELVESVIGQPIAYYAINAEDTNFHPLYGEAIEKTFLPPIRVYVLVDYVDEGYESPDSFGIEKRTSLNLFFHKRRLTADQNLFVRVGDVVEYNEVYFEITKLSEPRQLFGQAQHKLEIQAHCIRMREGTFNGK